MSLRRLGASWARLGALLGRLGGLLGPLGAILAHLGAVLASLGCVLGRLVGLLSLQNPPDALVPGRGGGSAAATPEGYPEGLGY